MFSKIKMLLVVGLKALGAKTNGMALMHRTWGVAVERRTKNEFIRES
jgi:hypothetical protein